MPGVAPSISFLICSTPRSGTTLLCEALRNTGLAGRPEEYFQELSETGLPRTPQDYFVDADDEELLELVNECSAPPELDPLFEPSRFVGWRAYFEWALRYGTTPNGVFGAKIMWSYLSGFVDRVSTELVDCAGTGDGAEAVGRALPGLRYVFVRRGDKAGQAVSLWRALQTWRWRGRAGAVEIEWREGQGEGRPLRYSFDAIDHLAGLLHEEEEAWREWFDRHGIEPLTVHYEELANAYEQTTAAILDHIGVRSHAGLELGNRRMRRQADELSKEWVGRYAAERASHVRL